MTLKKAIRILMEGTKAHLIGAGCGIGHQVPDGKKREEFIEAYTRAFKYVYGYDMPESEKLGM